MTEYRDRLLSVQIGRTGDTGRGHTVQLPKNYPHATRRDKDGNVCWTTKREAREIASRARGSGEDLHFDN